MAFQPMIGVSNSNHINILYNNLTSFGWARSAIGFGTAADKTSHFNLIKGNNINFSADLGPSYGIDISAVAYRSNFTNCEIIDNRIISQNGNGIRLNGFYDGLVVNNSIEVGEGFALEIFIPNGTSNNSNFSVNCSGNLLTCSGEKCKNVYNDEPNLTFTAESDITTITNEPILLGKESLNENKGFLSLITAGVVGSANNSVMLFIVVFILFILILFVLIIILKNKSREVLL